MAGKPQLEARFSPPMFVKELMIQKGIKLKDVAENTEHQSSYISSILNGQRNATDDFLYEILVDGCDLRPSEASEMIRQWRVTLRLNKMEELRLKNFIEIYVHPKTPVSIDANQGITEFSAVIYPRPGDSSTYQITLEIRNNRVIDSRYSTWDKNFQNIRTFEEEEILDIFGLSREEFWNLLLEEVKQKIERKRKADAMGVVEVPKEVINEFFEFEEQANYIRNNPANNPEQRMYNLFDFRLASLKSHMSRLQSLEEHYDMVSKAINLYLGRYE